MFRVAEARVAGDREREDWGRRGGETTVADVKRNEPESDACSSRQLDSGGWEEWVPQALCGE